MPVKAKMSSSVLKIGLVLISALVTMFLIEITLPTILQVTGRSYLLPVPLRYALDNVNFSPTQNTEEINGHQNTEQLDWMQQDVMHPYLGFVRNPKEDFPYNKYGFQGQESLYKRSPNTVIVGLFGGSVAWHIYQDNLNDLIDQVRQNPGYESKEVKVVSTALGGYKQPQQLMALNYLLSLGGEFDIIINLDGFNDAALPYSDNFDASVTAFYPRAWNLYARKSVHIPTLTVIGQTAQIQSYRSQWANFFRYSNLRYSQLGLLVWHLGDKTFSHQLQKLDAHLAELLNTQEQSVQVEGPTPPVTKEDVFATSLSVWRESSLQMARIAESNGARYYHVLQPNQYLPDSKPLNPTELKTAYVSSLPDDSFYMHAYRYKEAVETLYPEMRKAGKVLSDTHGVSFYDFTQIFKDHTETIYFDPCCHYNTHGSQIILQRLGDLIRTDYAQHDAQRIQ